MMATTNNTRVRVPDNVPCANTPSQQSESYDVGAPKPHGRVATDSGGGNRETNFLRCKKNVNIATLNTRTLRSINKQMEICVLAQKYNIDVLGIQEHRIVHTDEQLRYENLIEGYQLITASAARNNAGAAVGGVGILLSPFAKKSLSSITCETSIIKATFSGNPESSIIITYSPTNMADEEEVKTFYNELDSANKICSIT